VHINPGCSQFQINKIEEKNLVLIKLIEANSIPTNSSKYLIVEGHEIMIFNLKNEFFCYNARCTHAGAPLFEGKIDGDLIVCPWHGARFSIVDGSVVEGLATEPLKQYPLIIKDNFLHINTEDF
jgi:nitrite reductase/ring-hydroxylating ferredoxin subunit